jgi:hypothetical protein
LGSRGSLALPKRNSFSENACEVATVLVSYS